MNFHNLSNSNLISSFTNLVQQERKITAQVLECIAEIDRRKLYVEQGYSSLFDFLVKDHGYSPGAAMRRIDGARLLRELPEVKEKIESGALTLSQANQIQRAAREMKKTDMHMSTEEKQELVAQVEHASKKETEKIIAQALDLPLVHVQKETLHRDESVTLTMTFSKEQMDILEQVKGMVSHCVQDQSWVKVFGYLAKKELLRRTGLCTKKNKDIAKLSGPESMPIISPTVAATVARDEDPSLPPKSNAKPHRRQAIAAKLRKTLLHAHAKCEYRNSQGKRCDSTYYLQIDHIKSVSRGGGNELQNLQVLCGVHNRYKYRSERG